MSTSVNSPASFLRGAVRRLPVETALVALAVVTAIHLLHSWRESLWHFRLLLTAVLSVPLVFAFHERFPRSSPRALAGAAAIATATFLALLLALPDRDALERSSVLWGLLLVGLASYLLPFVVAAPRFSPFVRRFFEEVTTWALLGLGAVAAISATGYAIDTLFDVSMQKLTGDAILLTAGAISLLVLDRLLPDRAATGKVPELWRRLATAIGAPFVCVMLAILVVYQITVIARGELPSNTLSPLLIAAGFVGFLCTLIITAVAAEPVGHGALSPAEPHRFLRDRSIRLARAFPIVLLVLLPMALWALCVRIEQYGLTPFRVVRMAALLALAVLSVLGAVRWLRNRAALGWHVPATVAAFALVIAFGPLSAVNLSLRSQTARLLQLLDDAGIEERHVRTLTDEEARRVTGPIVISREELHQLSTALEDLDRLGGEPALRRVFSGEVEQCTYYWSTERCLNRLGVAVENTDPVKYDEPEVAAAVAQVTLEFKLQAAVQIPAGLLTPISFNSTELWDRTAINLPCPSPAPDEARAPGESSASLSLTELLQHDDRMGWLPPRTYPLEGHNCANPGVLLIQDMRILSNESGRRFEHIKGVWIR